MLYIYYKMDKKIIIAIFLILCCSSLSVLFVVLGGGAYFVKQQEGAVSPAETTEGSETAKTPESVDAKLVQIKWGDTDKCLDVSGGENKDGTKIQLWSCDSDQANQKLKVSGDQIKWANTDKCIDVRGGENKDGTQIQLWSCDAEHVNQKFSFI
jgi:uncharacterized protein YpmB